MGNELKFVRNIIAIKIRLFPVIGLNDTWLYLLSFSWYKHSERYMMIRSIKEENLLHLYLVRYRGDTRDKDVVSRISRVQYCSTVDEAVV